MKFGHEFSASLRKEEYPQEWVDSAVPYKQLKKCIKKVQIELHSLGLDKEILEVLWQQVDRPGPLTVEDKDGASSRPYQYSVSGK